MAERSSMERATADEGVMLARGARLLIIQSPYYADIATQLMAGARRIVDEAGCEAETVTVAGALEIPQALAAAAAVGAFDGNARRFDGVIVLGCVIRGETSHYDIVCNNANHWLMETAIRHSIPLGNAILTVDTHAQALARADMVSGKGVDAARACLGLIALKRGLASQLAGEGRE